MGGPGSGNWYRWDRRTTLEELHRIDVRYLRKHGFLQPGAGGTLSWTRGGETTGSVKFQTEYDRLVLRYASRVAGEDWQDEVVPIFFDRTPCNFGGERLWFFCPQCGARRAVLYPAGRQTVCRPCCGLPYQSQQEDFWDRQTLKVRKIRGRLGASPSLMEPVSRPKGMHKTTFDRLAAKERAITERIWGEVDRRCGDMF